MDRDGVVNIERGTFTWKKEDFVLVKGIVKLTKKAQNAGYKLVIITNQSGIARGLYGHDEVEVLHQYMCMLFEKEGVSLDLIYYCPHHPDFSGKCFCRKPQSLMIERAAARLGVDTSLSFMLGDKSRDLVAGRQAGCRTVGIGEEPLKNADFQFRFPDELIPFL